MLLKGRAGVEKNPKIKKQLVGVVPIDFSKAFDTMLRVLKKERYSVQMRENADQNNSE